MSQPFNVLIVEGDPPAVGQAEWLLHGKCAAATCHHVTRGSELDAALIDASWDVVVADYSTPGPDFLDVFHTIRHRLPDVPVILLADRVDETQASEVLDAGVWDFLLRDEVHRLCHLVQHAWREVRHRRAEQAGDRAWQRSEDRYRQVFLNASDSLFVFPLSPDGQPGRFTDVNTAASNMLGYTAEELLQLSPPDLVEPTERERLPAAFRELLSEKHQHVEFQLVTKDGRRIPVEISATLFDFESTPTVLAILTDVTGKKRAADMFRQATESAIRQHRAQARVDIAVIAALCVAVLIALPYVDLLGAAESWMLNHRFAQDVSIPLAFLAAASGVYARRRKKEIDSEIAQRTRVEESLRALQGELETRVQQRTAELRLRSAALDASADAIVITDQQGQIAWVNPAFTALTGYAPGDALGRKPSDLLKSGVQDSSFYRDMWTTILSGRPWRGEMTNRRKDGSVYSENMTITPVKTSEGAITHFVAIKRDLTEEKRLKAQFLQAQKMESVGRLAGGIAHDFNNLLTVIHGTAELATTSLADTDPLRADLGEIHRAGERAAALTRQLLAFSRKQVMKPQLLNLATLVADLRSLLQRVIGEDVNLVIPPADSQWSVKADPGQVEQVLLNLVVNARDAMPKGGTVTIETTDVEVSDTHGGPCEWAGPGNYVVLSVRDTGTGMDEKTRARLFEPFFTTKEPGKGTGLGLATVYGIVEQSGGHISVDTAPGRGTTFTICLPRVTGKPHADPLIGTTPPAVTRAETILVVEDEAGVREMARRMLAAGGYAVLTAANGAEALSLLERHRGVLHLMLTDVVMPGMNGVDLAARVAEIRPDMKILFTSGHTENAALRLAALDNTWPFIGKPYTMADLIRKVRETLDVQRHHAA
jgi:two-component system cell cycle sensor histidine kinase/response regulator CckA